MACSSQTTRADGSRLRPGSSVAGGLLIIDKPQGVTSFDAVAAVRSALHTKKVGHAGTLDPMATGMLVIAYGQATRLLTAIVAHDKTYEATIRLGQSTTTDDAEGDLLPSDSAIQSGACPPSVILSEAGSAFPSVILSEARSAESKDLPALLQSVINTHFLGPIQQVPNTFSAIKINGQRAYDLAREGKEVELKPREVTIHAFDILSVRHGYASTLKPGSPLMSADDCEQLSSTLKPETPDEATAVRNNDTSTLKRSDLTPVLDVDVQVSCSSGTYIRALARDLGAELGVGGYLTRLRRTRVGRFDFNDEAVANRAVNAHMAERTFTTKDGQSHTRAMCKLDIPKSAAHDSGESSADWLRACALTMLEAAAGAMPLLPVTESQAAALRHGQRIDAPADLELSVAAETSSGPAPETLAAYLPGTGEVVALVEPTRSAHHLKPVTVFAGS